MEKTSLPISSKHRRQEIEILTPEECSMSNEQQKGKRDMPGEGAVELLPALINIAQSYAEIKKMQVQNEGNIAEIREQGDLLLKKAEAFVKMEISRRETMMQKATEITKWLRDLCTTIANENVPDEIKKAYMQTVEKAIGSYNAGE